MKKITLLLFLFYFTISIFPQSSIEVTDQTIKISSLDEEVLYFGFAEGDQIVFNFKEINDKELKEIEIYEYPSASKFSDFKTSKIENKILKVNKTSIYAFRFYNSSLSGRVCKINIHRIPSNPNLEIFNSEVYWEMKQDTTWNTYTKDVIVRYDTIYEQKIKKELVKTQINEELIFDKSQRVHSYSNENGNKTSIFFTLPQNLYSDYKTTEVISWAYWVGVGEEANLEWKRNVQTVGKLAKGIATTFSSPLGALAVGAITDLSIPTLGEDVYYAVVDQQNRDLFMNDYQYRLYDQGKGIAGYRKFTNLNQGIYFIVLSNDNMIQGIEVNIKVVAMVETKIYQDKTYTEQIINPVYEKRIFKDPIINTSKAPVLKN
jgi:hypothetical protein